MFTETLADVSEGKTLGAVNRSNLKDLFYDLLRQVERVIVRHFTDI